MTLEELSKVVDRKPSTITSNFDEFVKAYEKRTGNTIKKTGRGSKADYTIIPFEEKRALMFFEEAGASKELFLNDETIKFPELMFRAFLGVIVKPDLTYRGTYKDFLEYINVKYTPTRELELVAAFDELAKRGYLYGGQDGTNPGWFLVGLTRRIEKQMGVGIERIRKCKEIAEKNHKQSWVPILKTWIAKEWLSDKMDQPVLQSTIAEYAGLNTKQVRESTLLLKANNLIDEEIIYQDSYIDELDQSFNKVGSRKVKKRLGTKSTMNGLAGDYYEPITKEVKQEICSNIGRQFGR